MGVAAGRVEDLTPTLSNELERGKRIYIFKKPGCVPGFFCFLGDSFDGLSLTVVSLSFLEILIEAKFVFQTTRVHEF